MSITIGGKTPEIVYIENKEVDSISINNEIVWQKTPTGPNYFYVQNDYSQQNVTFTLTKVGSPTTGSDLEYSTDGTNWDTCTYNSSGICSIKTFNMGDKVYFRSTTGFSQDYNNYYKFDANGPFSVGGDITTLSDYTNNSLTYIEVPRLFYNDNNLISAANLDCSKITQVGRMDTTHQPVTCSWEEAFYNCYNMTTPPDFPNVTLVKQYGFYSTFEGCTAMTTPPNMSRVSGAFRMGYARTFAWCENLSAGPNFNNISTIELHDARHNGTFEQTFEYCLSLQDAYAPNVNVWYENAVVDNITNTYTAYQWLSEVGSGGIVHVVSSSLSLPDSVSGCPTTAYGWTYSSL